MNKVKHTILALSILLYNVAIFANVATDTSITATVKMKLLAESDIPSTDINVTTNNAVVNLKGAVDTQLQYNKIMEIVSGIDGVNNIDADELTVRDSKSFIKDSAITAKALGKINNLFEKKKISADCRLKVETHNGVIHLLGEVKDRADINVITQTLKNMSEVKDVKTNVKVN